VIQRQVDQVCVSARSPAATRRAGSYAARFCIKRRNMRFADGQFRPKRFDRRVERRNLFSKSNVNVPTAGMSRSERMSDCVVGESRWGDR
jgi:hypothetical protein